MRLQQYLLREARVRKTNADVFLNDYAPIFMWSPKDGFLWAVWDEDERWMLFHGSKKLEKRFEYTHTSYPHPQLLNAYKGNDRNLEKFITGRISPDGRTIYVHDFGSRPYLADTITTIRYDKYVDKAIDNVYRYMKGYIK